jgi:hypothetical protein
MFTSELHCRCADWVVVTLQCPASSARLCGAETHVCCHFNSFGGLKPGSLQAYTSGVRIHWQSVYVARWDIRLHGTSYAWSYVNLQYTYCYTTYIGCVFCMSRRRQSNGSAAPFCDSYCRGLFRITQAELLRFCYLPPASLEHPSETPCSVRKT